MDLTVDIIYKYFPHLSDLQKERFSKLRELYDSWNQKINVISRKDIEMLYLKHVLHSLSIAKFLQFSPGSNVLDLGTGGGFPGIPLAIYFEDCHFYLIDGTAKKIKVVQEVINALKLTNVVAEQKRAEELKLKFDFVVNRAVADSEKLLEWSRKLIRTKNINALPNGIISLKGGDLSTELHELQKNEYIEEKMISDFFEEAFFETKKIVYIQA